MEYARNFPSQIADAREVVSKVEQELDQLDFEVRGELYDPLFSVLM